MTHDPIARAERGDRLWMNPSDARVAERHNAWLLRHPETRYCQCSCGCLTVLSRYNIQPLCGPCRKEEG